MKIGDLITLGRVRRELPPPPIRRMLRLEANLRLREVASVLGVTHTAVSRWETGKRSPRPDLAERYLALLERLAQELAGA